jgi:next-to-BRCA1 protein 1
MASMPPVNPDTLITVKVAINGSNRRFKLALRDLGANVLPDKVCAMYFVQPRETVT